MFSFLTVLGPDYSPVSPTSKEHTPLLQETFRGQKQEEGLEMMLISLKEILGWYVIIDAETVDQPYTFFSCFREKTEPWPHTTNLIVLSLACDLFSLNQDGLLY